MSEEAWIGVDLDGTLIKQDLENWNPEVISDDLIEPMAERIRIWLKNGMKVKIMTARVGGYKRNCIHVSIVRRIIEDWTEKHFGKRLEVTCEKDYGMIQLWDDRAIQVVLNTGERVDGKS